MLTRAQIEALDIIQPADGTLPKDCWDETSYNLRLGRQFVLITEQSPQVGDSSDFGIQIPPLGCVLVSTDEWLKMPLGVYGRWGLRIRHALSGLVFQAGPQIEPGYQGRLFGLLFNLSTAPRHLRYRESIWSIDFTALDTLPAAPAEKFSDDLIKFDVSAYATYKLPTGSISGAIDRLESDLSAFRREASTQAANLRLQRDELFESILKDARDTLARMDTALNAAQTKEKDRANDAQARERDRANDAQAKERDRASFRLTFFLGFILIVVCTVISTAVPTIVAKTMYDKDEFVTLLDRKNELKEEGALLAKALQDLRTKEAEHALRDKLLEQQLVKLRAQLSAAGQLPKEK